MKNERTNSEGKDLVKKKALLFLKEGFGMSSNKIQISSMNCYSMLI